MDSVTLPNKPDHAKHCSVEYAYATYRQALHAYLVTLTCDRQASEDVLHEAYTRLAREVAGGRSPRNTRAWLYQVARNIVTSGGRRQQVADRWRQRQRFDGTGASAEEHFLLRETRVELQTAMLDLNESDRLALRMAAEGFSGAEMAATFGSSRGAVRARLCRARGRLRIRLHRSGVQQPFSNGRVTAARP